MKHVRTFGFPLGLAVLWALLALRSPTTTYHLAPLLLAAAVPFAYRVAGGGSRSVTALLAVAGAAVTVVAGVALSTAGGLEGPSLLPAGGALLEVVAGAGVGGLIGLLAIAVPVEVDQT